MGSEMCIRDSGIVIKEILITTTFRYIDIFFPTSITISNQNRIDHYSILLHSNRIRLGIVQPNNDIIIIISLLISFLDLQIQLLRRHRGITHIICSVERDNRYKTTKSLIQWLVTQPLPLPPCIGLSSIVVTISCEGYWPHNSCLEIRGLRFVLYYTEVQPVFAHVCVHDWMLCAILIVANNTVVGYDGTFGREE